VASECAYGAPEQTTLAQYACSGPCGCYLVAPGECLECWSARKTYTAREVAMLAEGDPRRTRVREDRTRWTPRG
jgi:hypothetical protein